MHFLNSGKCRRRKVQTLALILIITILYFLLQFFSLSRLGHSQDPRKLHFKAADVALFDIAVSDNDNDKDKGDEGEGFNSNSKEILPRKPKPEVPIMPRGVHPSDAAHYEEISPGLFRCLKSQLQIPADRVNDDFCDCPDSSDEPGTSACPNGRFYCKVQLPHRDAQFVHSSKVNDGICDCCDGSDEWEERLVPSPMQLHGKSGAVFHTPCGNHCGDVLQLMEHEARIRRKGVILQGHYLDAARNLSSHHRQKYGPAGIFYLLSLKCFEHSAHEYQYTVCPFQSVKQGSGPVMTTMLGQQGHWVQQKSGDYILNMAGGDASLCPDGMPRETQIRFLCGLEDRVISVSEDQKCRYAVRFSTPAAC